MLPLQEEEMKFTLAIPLCLAAFAAASVRPRGVESNGTAKSLAQQQHHENDAANAPASPLPKGGTRPVIMPPAVLAGDDADDPAADDDGDAGHHLHDASSLDINTTLLPSSETFPPASPSPPASNASIPILEDAIPSRFAKAPPIIPPRGTSFAIIHRAICIVPHIPGVRSRTALSCYAQAVIDKTRCAL